MLDPAHGHVHAGGCGVTPYGSDADTSTQLPYDGEGFAPPSGPVANTERRKRTDPLGAIMSEHMEPSKKRVRFAEEPAVYEAPAVEEGDEEADGDREGALACKLQAVKADKRTTFLENYEDAEEDDPDEEDRYNDEGIPIEPFNLRREREEGFFDAEGSYVRYRMPEEEADAWVDSLPRTRIARDEALLQAVRRRSVALHEGEGLSIEVKHTYRLQLLELLLPGESVLDALRRMGGTAGRPPAPRGSAQRRRTAAAAREDWDRQLHDRMRSGRTVPAENRAAFDTLTALSDALLGDGDMRVYTDSREQLAASCAAAGPRLPTPPATAARSVAADPEQDIFADAEVPEVRDAGGTQQVAAQLGSAQPDAAQPDVQHAMEGVASASPQARMRGDGEPESLGSASGSGDGTPAGKMEAAGVTGGADADGATAGSDAMHVDDDAGGAGTAAASERELEGFVYDPASGFHYSSTQGLYYDAGSGLYGDASTGQWFVLTDGQRQRVA